jgi:hypothetical protein
MTDEGIYLDVQTIIDRRRGDYPHVIPYLPLSRVLEEE